MKKKILKFANRWKYIGIGRWMDKQMDKMIRTLSSGELFGAHLMFIGSVVLKSFRPSRFSSHTHTCIHTPCVEKDVGFKMSLQLLINCVCPVLNVT